MRKDISQSEINFYSPNKLLSLRDKNENKPHTRLICGNRSSGKTTNVLKHYYEMLKRKNIRQIVYFVRYKYELKDGLDQFFSPISTFFPLDTPKQHKVNERGYVTCSLNGDDFLHIIALNSANSIKKVSNKFNAVDVEIFDEFQTEDNIYLQHEQIKLKSIRTSIERGGGKMRRYVPLIAISNPITLLNPLYVDLGVHKTITPNTKFMRGDGYVLEQNMNKDAYLAQLNSGQFSEAEAKKYIGELENFQYMLDNSSNCGKISGRNIYLCSFLFEHKEYPIRYYPEKQMYYCGGRVDKTNKNKYVLDKNTVSLHWTIPPNVSALREMYNAGRFMYSDVSAKNAIINYLGYK